jgi:pyridoxine 5-phosphate synthase
MDPLPDAMRAAADVGTHRIELYTEPYAAAFAKGDRDIVNAYRDAAIRATEAGLEINAGHDLNLENLGFFLASVPGVEEVSIGHALIADALEFGLAETVRKYARICAGGSA